MKVGKKNINSFKKWWNARKNSNSNSKNANANNNNSNANNDNNANANNNNSNANNNNTNKSSLPYAGSSRTVIFIVLALGVSAVYFYKKIADYNI